MRTIYSAPTAEAGQGALEAFAQKWGSRYTMIAKSWLSNWPRIIRFFEFPEEIQRVIYTTNAIESLNYSLRKIIKNRSLFPNDEAVFKFLYLALRNIARKWTMPINGWSRALQMFAIIFEDRVPLP